MGCLHGSCFELDEKGILLVGSLGRKSSITAAFCQDLSRITNDDIVEILLRATTIIPIKTRIKLWRDFEN
jgi:hypothetical protein